MTRLTRLGLGALLVLGLAVPAARSAPPDKLIPADADTVASINVRQILDSDIAKKYAVEQVKQALEGKDLKTLLTELGLDPLKDIDRAVVATLNTNKTDTKFLMIVHGSFDPDKLYRTAEAYTKKEGDKFAMVKDGNTVMFKYQPENGDPPMYGTVVNDRTVIAASDKKLISDALAADKSTTPTKLKPELAALIKKMDERASVFAVSVVKDKFEGVKLPGGGNIPVDLSGLEKVLAKTETIAVTVKIGTDVNAEVTLGMKDDDAATDMQNAIDDLLKQVKPLAALAGAADPRAKPLGDILGGIKTTAKNKDVVITGKVTGDAIGKMMKPDGGN
jgi:ribosomal protein L18E